MIIKTTTPVVVPPGSGGSTGGGGNANPPVVEVPSGGGVYVGSVTKASGPVAATPQANHYVVQLRGTDNSGWNLTTGRVRLLKGSKLFHAVPITHWWDKSPSVDGAQWQGMRAEEQTHVLPLLIDGEGDWKLWRDTERAFFDAIDPGSRATIYVTSPEGVSRYIQIRYNDDGDIEDDEDPLIFARRFYVLSFISEDPFWLGEVVKYDFSPDKGQPFLSVGGYYISPVAASDSSVVSNPGDIDTYYTAVVNGPASSFSVGVGDSLVSSNVPIIAGQQVKIYSDPKQGFILNEKNVSVYENMTDVDMSNPIPAGTDIPLKVSITGTGDTSSIQVTFTAKYRRPTA